MKSLVSTAALAAALLASPAFAVTDDAPPPIVVIGDRAEDPIARPAATTASISAQTLAEKINATSVEDALKYLPSLVIRKRNIGDTFAPIATRTSGLGASARNLIYADGALLSALIANNNGNGSPRWSLVTPEEIDHIDVMYGPFSAAYAGNSIGTVVNITTRNPDHLEARATALTNIQTFDYYGTHRTLPTWQASGAIGNRFGPLSLLASATQTTANSQPVSFVTATAAPTGTTGAYSDASKTGAAIKVLGACGLEHHVQDTYKIKAALDITPDIRATYVLGIWHDATQGAAETYLTSPTGQAAYTGAFSSGVYTRDALHFSHALNLTGTTPRLDWQVVGTIYHYAHDLQNTPTSANVLPAAATGGVGTILRQDGTGWITLDAKAARRSTNGAQILSLGAHADRMTLANTTYAATDWLDTATQGAPTAVSQGRTRTLAIWAQDAVKLARGLTLTLGGRYEEWRAYGGYTYLNTAAAPVIQAERRATGFSPKAALEWKLAPAYALRLSAGQAFRFPTVGELYQTTTVGTLLANPNPNLSPERARSAELAFERRGAHGTARLSLFNEVIANALISQTGPVVGGAATSYVQNVNRTRARGVEIALERRDIGGAVDVQGSVTYADAITSADTVFPAAIGKLLPSVPRWKANAAVTWHPTSQVSLTTAARYASRNYANLDNSDVVGNTFGGFYQYFIVDARATFRVNDHVDFAIGVDNLGNDKYFLYHPFPQRSFTAQVNWRM